MPRAAYLLAEVSDPAAGGTPLRFDPRSMLRAQSDRLAARGLHPVVAPVTANRDYDNRLAYARIPPERGPGARIEIGIGDQRATPGCPSRPCSPPDSTASNASSRPCRPSPATTAAWARRCPPRSAQP
nr:glutamine synthetase [Streptomyces sp. TRM68367]